jgi:hypothetical protein
MTEEIKNGAFTATLKRNNDKIRADRAELIEDSAKLTYRRAVEDIEMEIKKLETKQKTMLDMSPDDTTTIINSQDFDADEYVTKDIELAKQIRNEKIKLEVVKERYGYLFG